MLAGGTSADGDGVSAGARSEVGAVAGSAASKGCKCGEAEEGGEEDFDRSVAFGDEDEKDTGERGAGVGQAAAVRGGGAAVARGGGGDPKSCGGRCSGRGS